MTSFLSSVVPTSSVSTVCRLLEFSLLPASQPWQVNRSRNTLREPRQDGVLLSQRCLGPVFEDLPAANSALRRRPLAHMPKISPPEFFAQPLRVHSFLAGVALHDVWAVDLPAIRERITLQEFRRRTKRKDSAEELTLPTRLLIRLRILIGRVFGWTANGVKLRKSCSRDG
jgi:hypothetical protein